MAANVLDFRVSVMDRFQYKKVGGITALSAHMTDFKYKKHSHQEYALGVTLQGTQQFNLDGEEQTSYQSGIMLLNPEQSHDGMARDRSGIDYVMLYIEPNVFLDVLGRKSKFYFTDPVVYRESLQRKILSLANAVFREEDAAMCDDLFSSLALDFETNVTGIHIHEDVIIRKAKEMIQSASGDVMSLDSICIDLALSKFKLIRLFKASEGITPYQFFLNCKVEKAKQMIEATKDFYAAVAGCGFVDLAHLNKHFVCRYGVTPFAYLSCVNH